MSLAEKLHHTSRGQRFARAGEEGHEEHDALRRQKPPPPPQVFFRLYDEEDAEWGARPESLWSVLQTLPPWCKFSTFLCRPKGEELADILKRVDTQTPVEYVIAVPKISNDSIQPRFG